MKNYSGILNHRFRELHPGRLSLCRRTAFAAVLIILFTGCFTYAHARRSGTGFELEYRPMYESNIYHSYADIDVTGALLNLVSARVRYKTSLSTRLKYSLVGYAVFDLYSGYANRNKTSIGFVSKPVYRYAPFARVSAEIDVSRRNKDLTDDSGQSLARTLKKSKLDFALNNRLKIGDLRLEQRIFYGIDDYDERDTVVITSVDTTKAKLISYDYHDISWGLLARYKLSRRFYLRLTFASKNRAYDERRTYTVQYGAIRGRPYAIREYRENTIESRIEFPLLKMSDFVIEVVYAKRKDNFENFYGFTQWQYKIKTNLRWSANNLSNISFRFKSKDYTNYHTGNTGQNNRVTIDYADIQLEHHLALSHLVTLSAYLRNYNKVSNDPSFDYYNLTMGTGISLQY